MIIPSISYANSGLGKVTVKKDIPIEGISINAESSYTGTSVTLTAVYTPTNTSETGAIWSIESGNEYATIDSNTGVLSILDGASDSTIVVKVTSSKNDKLTDTKEIKVSYIKELYAIATKLGNYVDTGVNFAAAPDLEVDFIVESTSSTSSEEFVVFGVRNSGQSGVKVASGTNVLRHEDIYSNVCWQSAISLGEMSFKHNTGYNPTLNGTEMGVFLTGLSGTLSSNSIYLFDINQGNSPCQNKQAYVYIKEYKASLNGNAVIDLIPILKNGTAMFYDKVSGTFFSIKGSNPIKYKETKDSDEVIIQ